MYWYHATTKHSYNSVRTNPNRLSWEDQPSTYKNYPETYQKFKLNLEEKEDKFLYHIAGLTVKKSYPVVSIICVSIQVQVRCIPMNSTFKYVE